jgi:glycosyltransferase involved in cell wall biosynthesis
MPSSQPLCILHVVRAPAGGVLRHITDLSRSQAARGHRVGVICDAVANGAIEEERLRSLHAELPLGVTRISVARGVGLGDLAALRAVARVAAPLNPDVLHGHGAKGGAFARLAGALLRRKGSSVARFYAPHGGSLHYAPSSLEGRFYFTVERLLERATEALFFVSDYERAAYAEKIGTPRCDARLVHNGLTPSEFEPVPPAADATDVLFLGHMRTLKGVDVLIRALAIAARQRPVTAHLVGAGEDRARFESLAAELGLASAIRFRDPMPAREAFQLGRIMAVPSRHESLPYVILEAVAAGMPLIASRVGGIPEILTGAAPELVPSEDPQGLADALLRDLADPAGAAERASRRREEIRNSFSVQAMAEAIETTYRSHLRGPVSTS